MKTVRIVGWALLIAALAAFSVFNWNPVEVRIWEGLILETKVPVLVIIAFLIGLLPMWLVHLATTWQMKRRIGALETATRTGPPSPFPEHVEDASRQEERERAALPADQAVTWTPVIEDSRAREL